MKIELDDDVQVARFVRGLASVGLALSNDREGGLRIHNAPMSDAQVDAMMRAGFRRLRLVEPRLVVVPQPPGPPPPRDVTGRTPPPQPPSAA